MLRLKKLMQLIQKETSVIDLEDGTPTAVDLKTGGGETCPPIKIEARIVKPTEVRHVG